MKTIKTVKTYIAPVFTRSYWQMLGDYVGIGRKHKLERVTDAESLAVFLGSRASHVAQASLYGYLRTRAGTRFPELFENPDILKSINIAKWHIWLACVSDLGLFAGQCMHQSGKMNKEAIQSMMQVALQRLLDDTGEPDEAGTDFTKSRDKVVQRVTTHDWTRVLDDDTLFSQSPEALFYWSPIADELKERDETIVKNSIRFRWIEVRRNTRRLIDSEALLQSQLNTSH